MIKFLKLALICFVAPAQVAIAQCISGNCANGNGVYLYSDKSRYEGPFANNQPNGKGQIYYASGSVFDGMTIAWVKTGFGKYNYYTKDYYEGNFKNDKFEGTGKFVTSDGSTYEGLYKEGQLNGNGALTFKDGDKYVGNFVSDMPDGTGILYYFDGNRFEGTFKKGRKNGSGILYYAKGGTLKGVWIEGVYVSGANLAKTDSSFVKLTKTLSGIYEVPILINGVLKIDMIFDTGASEIYLTPDVISTLARTKTIKEEDILEGKNFMDASGKVNPSLRFNLKEIKIGKYVIKNVACGVSQSLKSPSLLGLNALGELGKVEINFKENTLKVIK